MSNTKIKFDAKAEANAASAGLASTMLQNAKGATISFDRQWTSKDGHERTKGGKGCLGAWCTINSSTDCWINLSAVIKFLSQQANSFGLIEKAKKKVSGKEVEETYFVFDPSITVLVDCDKDGNFTKIKV